MNREYYQAAVASVWIVAIGVGAVLAGVSSVAGFAVLTVLAAAPPLAMQLLWRDPPQTTSEAIREARR